MKDLSIIIVNWNTKELLDKCLSSVYRFAVDIDYEIIVSDNGSEDGSIEMLNEKYKDVILIKNNDNLGFGKANNIAVKKSQGKCILFLNSDTELIDNSIKILFDYMCLNKNVGACGGTLLYPDKRLQLSFGNFPTFPRIVWITLSGILHIKYNKKPLGIVPYNITEPIKVDYIVGADLMVKKKTLDEIGVFDENFFAYFEETDLCYRIKKQGYEIWFLPQSKIIHVFEGSFKKFSKRKFEIFTESQFKYYKKNLGYYKPLKYYFLINFLIKMGIYRIINKEKFIQVKEMYDIMKKVNI